VRAKWMRHGPPGELDLISPGKKWFGYGAARMDLVSGANSAWSWRVQATAKVQAEDRQTVPRLAADLGCGRRW